MVQDEENMADVELPTKLFNGRFYDVDSMKVTMLQSHLVLSSQSAFSNCGLETTELLVINTLFENNS